MYYIGWPFSAGAKPFNTIEMPQLAGLPVAFTAWGQTHNPAFFVCIG